MFCMALVQARRSGAKALKAVAVQLAEVIQDEGFPFAMDFHALFGVGLTSRGEVMHRADIAIGKFE